MFPTLRRGKNIQSKAHFFQGIYKAWGQQVSPLEGHILDILVLLDHKFSVANQLSKIINMPESKIAIWKEIHGYCNETDFKNQAKWQISFERQFPYICLWTYPDTYPDTE
jgi:hypothetical protein